MTKQLVWAVVIAVASVSLTLDTRAADLPPVEAFGSIPSVSEVALSPNGNFLAWYDATGKEPRVVMFDLASKAYKRTVPVDAQSKVRDLTWSDDETLLVTVSYFEKNKTTNVSRHYELFRTVAIDIGGGKERILLMADDVRPAVTGSALLAARMQKPKTVLMSTLNLLSTVGKARTGSRIATGRRDTGWVYQVFEVDTHTGKGIAIETGSAFTDEWAIDSNAHVVARSDWDPQSETYTVLAKDGNGWRELLRTQRQSKRRLYGVDRAGTAVIVSGTNAQGNVTLMAFPLDGSPGKTVLDEGALGVRRVSYDRFTHLPQCVGFDGIEETLRWLDPAAEKRYNALRKAFPGKENVWAYGRSENNQRVLVSVQDVSSPAIYYLVDFEARKADIVGEEYPALANATLGEVRTLHYKARDGASVPAYLTLPPGSQGTKLPLVILVHRGPHSRDDNVFDWWAQFLASRGYAVLQPQFRGSTGFGDKWMKAGYRQWGKLMQDDVSDGVLALVEQGIADAHKVCIVGASYGGYSALAGAVFTPGLYRCAVSVNGVSNLPEFLAYEKRRWMDGDQSGPYAFWQERIGSPFDADVIERSPVKAAGQVKAAVLLLHGMQDTVVPVTQSEAMARALTAAKAPVSFIKLDGEDHWLSKTATRVRVLTEMEKFLAAQLQ